MSDVSEEHSIFLEALGKFGEALQINVAIKEMAELIQILMMYKRLEEIGNPEEKFRIKNKILEELADVSIMLEQLKLIFDVYSGENVPDFEEWKERKLCRLLNRVEQDR